LVSRLKKTFKEGLKTIRKKGTFGRNLAISAAGNTSAYLIGFILSPIIARIYQPEAYGLFALFNAFVVSLSIFSTLDYLSAFILPRSTRDFIPLLQLSLILITIVSGASMLGLVFYGDEILRFFNAQKLGGLVYFVPIIVIFTGLNRCLDYWNVREKEFKQGAKAKVVAMVGAKLITIAYGVISKGNPFGFVIGELIGKPITSYALVSNSIRKNLSKVRIFSFTRIIRTAVEYRNYPIYSLPANTLITLGTQLPIYLLSLYFASSDVGHFSLAISLINAPTQVIGMAAAHVFFQKAADTYQSNPERLIQITKKLFRQLTYIAVIPFSLIAVFGDLIFTTIFGSNWEIAGNFASYLSLMAYMNFISISICSLFRVIREEKLQFYIISSGALMITIGLVLALTFQSSYHLVMVYSIISALLQFVLIGVVLSKINLKPFLLLVELIVVLTFGILIMYLFRSIWSM